MTKAKLTGFERSMNESLTVDTNQDSGHSLVLFCIGKGTESGQL